MQNDTRETEFDKAEVAIELDGILNHVSLEFGNTFIVSSRYPETKWELTCPTDMKEAPVKFSCHVHATSLKVIFNKAVDVSYGLSQNIINCCHFNHVVGQVAESSLYSDAYLTWCPY